MTERLKSLADGWREVRELSDEALADLIRRDRIDVLVDLDGHDIGNRLLAFARRPAPVQVTYNGYMNTTGLAAMDWRITDAWHDPPGTTEALHTEKLYRLPGGNWCYAPGEALVRAAGKQRETGDQPPIVRNGYVTFGSLNKLVKASPSCLRLWQKVLEAVPRSRLMLLTSQGDTRMDADVRKTLSAAGLDVSRVDLVARASPGVYFERFTEIDIAMDPFPFNGITTTADALWMGVPVVTLAGETFASRAGVSLLSAAGLQEWIAADEEAYVGIAKQLAEDSQRAMTLRTDLRERMVLSQPGQGARLARELTRAFEFMWRTCRRKEWESEGR